MGGSLSRCNALLIRQMHLFRGSPARVVSLFVWIGIDMVLWGFMSRYLNTLGPRGYTFVPSLLGAVLLWDFFIRVMQGVTMAFFEDVWSRNFLNLFASPITVFEYIGGLVLSSVVTSSVCVVFMLVLAMAVFGLPLSIYGLLAAPFGMVLFLFGIAFGVMASALVLRLGPAAEWFVWPIPAMISPFVGVFYPLSTLPAWMRVVSKILPPSYVFEGLRASTRGEAVAFESLAISLALAFVYLGLAAWIFSRVFRHALKTGLIARYSAESLS